MFGVRGWESAATAMLAVACGGHSRTIPSGSSGSSGGGSAGSGGSDSPVAYSFQLVPPVPQRPPLDGDPGAAVTAQVVATVSSADGTRIAGTTTYFSEANSPTFDVPSPYVWSEATGSLPLPGPAACISQDGAWTVGLIADDTGNRVYRADANGNIEMLEVAGDAAGSINSPLCSANGSAVLGEVIRGSERSLALWRQGRNEGRFSELSVPGARSEYGVNGVLSDDGSLLVIHSYIDDMGSTRLFALPTDGPLDAFRPLENPSGYSACFTRSVSADGSSILGHCIDAQDRLQAVSWGKTEQASLDSGFFVDLGSPNATRDGGTALGFTESGNLAVWRDGALLGLESRGTWLTIEGVGSDAVAFAQDAAGGKLLKWTGNAGLQPFPEDQWDFFVDASADGRLVVGGNSPAPGSDGYDALLWDSQGARNLRDVLTAGGVDLAGVGQLVPRLVVSGNHARLVGSTLVDDRARVWIATLPAR